jgi:cobalt-zinc-cadmium efflux system protein
MASGAAVSLGVVVADLVILFTGWTWLDAATSLVTSAVIVAGTWSLLRDSMAMSPSAGIDSEAVRRFLEQRDGVVEIHDLHIWPMSTTEVALHATWSPPGSRATPTSWNSPTI